jgi:hypothetical protein
MYYNVTDVRTADDALITVKLMLFFELAKLDRMLDTTHDPIADFINSVCADIIAFAASMPYELFVEKTAALNDLETYPNLTVPPFLAPPSPSDLLLDPCPRNRF